jgi:hypothetical protein
MLHTSLPFVLVLLIAPLIAAEPDAKALAHGTQQVEQMLRDRPEMTRYPSQSGYANLSMTDPQVQWAIRKFAGEDTGFLIHWEPKPPMDVHSAEHTSRDASGRPAIRIAKVGFPITVTKENAFDHMWSGVIFELLNITRHEKFDELRLRAWKREIDRESYVWGMAKVEYDALRQLQSYATSAWIPWAATARAKMHEELWWTKLPATFEEWKSRYTERNSYPWHPYGLYFDALTQKGS